MKTMRFNPNMLLIKTAIWKKKSIMVNNGEDEVIYELAELEEIGYFTIIID